MTKRLTVCLDSNIYVSAIGFGGKPVAILELALKKEFLLITSEHIQAEVLKNLIQKVGLRPKDLEPFLFNIADVAAFFSPTGSVKVADDPNDDLVIETALMGFADVLVTGDKALVDLKTVGDLKIEKASIFLQRFSHRT